MLQAVAMADLTTLAHEELCYLTTTGRSTGTPHEIEIWFAFHEGAFFLLAGGRDTSDWVLNLREAPEATLRIGDVEAPVHADEPGPDDPVQSEARHLLREKYAYEGDDLVSWAKESLLVRLRPA
jgi:hypothetical protein